jgi:putative Holliday junction resolvase
MRRLGVDPGSVRTGLALAEADVPVATPLVTVTHASIDEGARRVAEIAKQREVEQIVIGLPLAMDGREGDAARRARRFADALSRLTRLPVVMWDERLSSASAERALRAQGKHGKARRAVVDQAAATLLLQSYLDAHRDRTWDEEEADAPDLPEAEAADRRGQRKHRGSRR